MVLSTAFVNASRVGRSLMTKEAEQRETLLRDDMEKSRSQQEQTLGTFDTRIDAMIGRRTQAIMYRLDGLLGDRSGSRNRGTNSGEPNREPRVNFNEQSNRGRTYRSTRAKGSSSSYVIENYRPRGPTNIRGDLTSSRPTSNERPMRDANATRRSDSRSWITRIKEEVNPANRTGGEFRSLNQRATTIKRGIYVMQWLQPFNH